MVDEAKSALRRRSCIGASVWLFTWTLIVPSHSITLNGIFRPPNATQGLFFIDVSFLLSQPPFPDLLLRYAATCSCLVTKNFLCPSCFHTRTPISSAYRHGASNSACVLKSLNKKPTVAFILSPSNCHSRIWSTTVGGSTGWFFAI